VNSVRCTNAQLKRNIDALEDSVDKIEDQLATAQHKLEDTQAKKAKLNQENAAMQKRVGRIPDRLKLTKAKAITGIQQHAASVSMKIKGAISEPFKRLYRQLLDHGVATTEVNQVIHNVADVVGVSVTDHVSAHSVRRANTEGYIHAQVQVAAELSQADRE
jgi:F0F1-type ATP synthase membrane subunit b/b'